MTLEQQVEAILRDFAKDLDEIMRSNMPDFSKGIERIGAIAQARIKLVKLLNKP